MTADTTAIAPMAITMGDASGVGPEIVLRRAADGAFINDSVVVYGDAAILRHGAELLGVDIEIEAIDHPDQWRPGEPLRVVDLALLQAADHRPGRIDAASGAAARQYVVAATNDALAGRVAGIVTMPMNKEATQLTDAGFVGHTELIAEACGVQRFTMMLTAGDLAVTHISTHVSLQEAIRRVTTARVTEVIELTYETLHRFLEQPRIAVCGVNPHAGEHGLFGSEDIEQIAPAIEAARAAGIDATGPHPADTVFHQAVHRKRFDAIVCMYHDQGHTPMKLLAFESGVNVTVGLPIVRTSVDHGTAFDIAWQGVAFTGSLDHALSWARRLTGDSRRVDQ
jgi:4-hydroxythreonine-4-phosphate dehydrogenase